MASISFLAPAVRIDEFDKLLGGHIAQHDIRVFIANLTDAAELSDDTCKPYGHSLLYLVSRSFEEHEETPLLGMERHLVPALVDASLELERAAASLPRRHVGRRLARRRVRRRMAASTTIRPCAMPSRRSSLAAVASEPAGRIAYTSLGAVDKALVTTRRSTSSSSGAVPFAYGRDHTP